MAEMRDIVDENDKVLYQASREEVIEKKLLHRGAAVIVLNSKGQIFIHKRVNTKHVYPGMWAMFFGGGVQAGEDYEQGARRELFEESGIKDIPLKFLYKTRFTNEIDDTWAQVYSCVYDGNLTLEKSEIEKGMFVSIEELDDIMKKQGEYPFCPDDVEFFKMYIKMK